MTAKRDNGWTARLKGTVFAGLALGALATGPAMAAELRYAVGLPENNFNYESAVEFAQQVEATSDLKMKVYAMQLLSLKEIPGGVRDGLADLGFTLFAYFPAEFSELNLAANLALQASSGTETKEPGLAMIGATIEYAMLNCPDCMAQMKGLNTVYTGSGASVEYGLVCNKPVKTLADLKGTKVRAGSADLARFVEYFGGTQVAIGGNEIYDALSTGNVDCSLNQPENLLSLRLMEVGDHFTHLMPGGMFAGIGPADINRDTWKGLSVDERRAVMNAAARLGAASVFRLKAKNEVALKQMTDAGKNVYQVSAEDRAAIAAFAAQDVNIVRTQFVDQYKLNDVDGKIAKISELIEKWKGLINDTDMTVDAVAQLYIDQVYSKLDLATYGTD